MNETDVLAMIENMPMEKKLELLSRTDKAYIRRYIERAVLEQQRTADSKRPEPEVRGTQKR